MIGQFRVCRYAPANVEPITVRELYIQDNQIRTFPGAWRNGPLARRGTNHLKSGSSPKSVTGVEPL
jgi:hypothetical protein